MSEDRFYLIVRDREHGLADVTEFDDSDRALRAYADTELRYRAATMAKDPLVEVVLIAGESLEAVQQMYPHYFSKGDRSARQEHLLAGL